MSELETGAIVDGRYRVRSRLGTGGMADVYLAQDEQLGREVALKLLHRRFAEDPDFVERFRREAQAAASLSHPNVVSVFDRGAYDGTYYIAMEYLPGRSLKELIREEAPLHPERAIDLAVQILKAARFAHRRGVIHRDLKPHNVIVDDNDHATVTDFGIARAGASDMTETGSIMGTAQYLSPEQAQGHAVSAPSDLYSVAIVLYEMLTGKVPFDGDSAVTIALKHVSEPPAPPSRLNPAVSPALDQVVLWALNKNPADRPADADQFIVALEQARDAPDVTSAEVTASMRAVSVPSYAGAGPGLTAAAPVPMRPISSSLVPYGPLESAESSVERGGGHDRNHDDRHRAPIWPWIVGLLVLILIGGGVAAFLLTRPKHVVVPTLIGLSQQQAQARVQALNLNAGTSYAHSRSVPDGDVIDQSPRSGKRVNEGSTVTMIVSSGAGSVQIPPVVALTQKQAIKELKVSGLSVAGITTRTSSDVNKGDAISTSPGAGTTVARGFGVTLVVSAGQSLPNVTNMTLSQAQQTLSGYNVTTIQQTSTTVSPGTVISQSPPAQTPVAAGSKVTLTVAKAATTATVPAVIGYTAAGATSTLLGDGFEVIPVQRRVTNPTQVGNVINQRPHPNKTVAKGSIVTIIVGVAPPTGTTTSGTTTTPPTTTSTTPPTSTTPTTPAGSTPGP